MVWTKADINTHPKGKCLALYMEPSFGGYTLEVTTAYFDNPHDYEDKSGRGWVDWYSEKNIKVTHFMELPDINVKLLDNSQQGFRDKFDKEMKFGIVPNSALILK